MTTVSVLLTGLGALVVFLVLAYIIGNKKDKARRAAVEAQRAKWDKSTVDWAREKAELVKAAPTHPKPAEAIPVPVAVTNKVVEKIRISEPEQESPTAPTPPGNPLLDVALDAAAVMAIDAMTEEAEVVVDEPTKSFHEQLLEDTPTPAAEPVEHSSPHDGGHDGGYDSGDSGSSDSGSSDGGSSDGGD